MGCYSWGRQVQMGEKKNPKHARSASQLIVSLTLVADIWIFSTLTVPLILHIIPKLTIFGRHFCFITCLHLSSVSIWKMHKNMQEIGLHLENCETVCLKMPLNSQRNQYRSWKIWFYKMLLIYDQSISSRVIIWNICSFMKEKKKKEKR